MQVMKRLALGMGFNQYSPYATLIYCLTHHSSPNVQQTCRMLLQKIGPSGKKRAALCGLFSFSEEERISVAQQMFHQKASLVLSELPPASKA